MTAETRQLLMDAQREIRDLRRRNEILSAQMGVVEVFAAVAGLKRPEQGFALDVVWAIQKHLDDPQEAATA